MLAQPVPARCTAPTRAGGRSRRPAVACPPFPTTRSAADEDQRPQPARRQGHGVNEGAAIANVEIDVNGQRLVASITVEAARELGLREGAEVTAIVKASDVILATAD